MQKEDAVDKCNAFFSVISESLDQVIQEYSRPTCTEWAVTLNQIKIYLEETVVLLSQKHKAIVSHLQQDHLVRIEALVVDHGNTL